MILDLLIFAVVALAAVLAYVLYRHADLRAQAEKLATAVLAEAKADAKRIARQISEKV